MTTEFSLKISFMEILNIKATAGGGVCVCVIVKLVIVDLGIIKSSMLTVVIKEIMA